MSTDKRMGARFIRLPSTCGTGQVSDFIRCCGLDRNISNAFSKESYMTRCVFMGTPEFAVPSLTSLLRKGFDVVGVLTKEDQPAGRGQKLEASAVKQLAQAHGLTIQQPSTLRAAEALAALAGLAPDVIVVAAYGLILPQEVLDLPRFGCINVHGSVLPRWRGAAPIAAALLAGDVEAGVSIMRMDAGVDTGPMLSAAYLPVAADDTTGTLTPKLASLGADLVVRTLPRWLAGELAPIPQPEEGITWAPRITKEEGLIDWTEPAALIERRVRAYQPWPTAYTRWNGQGLKVLRARAEEGAGGLGLGAGTIIAGKAGSAGVVTGRGVLWLEEMQLAGKRATPIAAFLQGARGFVGSRLPS
jgi:methionyl-tRNA formyltransferase